MTYALIATARFDKDMNHLMPKDRRIASKVMADIAEQPYSFKPLSGSLQGLMSARFGSFRIIFTIDEPHKQVFLVSVKARERVYE